MNNVRLVCASHNQHAAERAFGVEFMEQKRREARERSRAADGKRARVGARDRTHAARRE